MIDLQREATLANSEANLSAMTSAISKQAQAVQNIYRMPNITPEEKRQLIDGLYYGMTETARVGNEIYRKFEETKKTLGAKKLPVAKGDL